MPYKYIHINTRYMKQKGNKSIYQVNLNHNPIRGAKRVAIVKASFPNTHNNIEAGMENNQLIFKTFVRSDPPTTHILTVPDGLYTIEELMTTLNQLAALAIADGNSPPREVLNFSYVNNRVNIAYTNTNTYTDSETDYYVNWTFEMFHSFGPNNKQILLEELGFVDQDVEMVQTNDSTADDNVPPTPSPLSNVSSHIPTIENTPFFYIDSPELASQNILTIDENTNNEVQTGNHLISLINNVPRYAYLSYEASSPIFHELHKDITHFTLEIKNHRQKNFQNFNFFFCVLAFEYEEPFQYYEQQRREYSSQGFSMAHKI